MFQNCNTHKMKIKKLPPLEYIKMVTDVMSFISFIFELNFSHHQFLVDLESFAVEIFNFLFSFF